MTKPIHNFIGTSGWNYKHWSGIFYPKNARQSDLLRLYAKKFDTTEINTTFYGIPRQNTIELWKKSVPKDFIFSVKANRFITHRKKLNNAQNPLENFLSPIKSLSRKLGPILFQLPPNWNYNGQRLESFLKLIRLKYGKIKIAVEFRNNTWYNPETEKILKKFKAALCFHDMAGNSPPEIITADFIYIRQHGFNGAYAGHYGLEYLKYLSKKIKSWNKCSLPVYIYFNNDQEAAAPFDALNLKKFLN